jgi:tetratricopeptide (TPR) repeat protein
MATEADKKRAQQIVDEALQQHHKAKSKHEKRQWAETHLPLLEQAISLDPDNYKAWAGRGTAKSQLGDLEGAISDFRKAIEINPENDAIRCSLQAAEIALASHNNPSETLLRLDKKSSDQSDAADIDIMRELIRSQNTPS